MKLGFGKYAGVDLAEVPTGYLTWLLARCRETAHQLEAELELRGQFNTLTCVPMVEQVIHSGYRALAKLHHPDAGGDPEAMKELNAAVEWLRHTRRRWARN